MILWLDQTRTGIGRTPLVAEAGSSIALTDARLAVVAGVREDVAIAFREGVPYWRLPLGRNFDNLAKAIGSTPEALKAAFRAAESSRQTRGAQGDFPSQATHSRGLRG